MSASTNPSTLFSQQFSTNVELLAQQRLSKFQQAVMVGSGYAGKQVSPVDQLAAVNMAPVTSRFQSKQRTDVPRDRRWVVPSSFDLQLLEDSFDRLKMISDIRSGYVQTTVASANRQKDDIIIDAFFAAALTGETGGSSTTFPTSTSTNVVGVSEGATTSNISVAKLKKGIELLLSANIDMDLEEVYCAVGPKQNTALLNEIEIIGNDFRPTDKPQVDPKGRVIEFMGIRFLHTNRLDTGTDDAAGTSRAIPLWCKSGMHLGLWADNQYRVRQAEELKGNPWEVYSYMTVGATRVDEAKVIKIWARES